MNKTADMKAYKKEYREKNRDRLNAVRKEWIKNNESKVKESRDKYEEENKEHIAKVRAKHKEKYREYSQKPEVKARERKRLQLKRDTDPIFRLNNSVSAGVRISLKENNLSKNKRRWESLVGYSIETLKQNLEKQFKDGMTWDNYGEWHIDHIIPLRFFKYDSTDDVEFRYCWSLHNLQPLWKEDNLCKNDKIVINGIKTTSRVYRKGA